MTKCRPSWARPACFARWCRWRRASRLNLAYNPVCEAAPAITSSVPWRPTAATCLGSTTTQADRCARMAAVLFIVYPRIVLLRNPGLPSQSPFGTLPSREQIFEDPTRIRGVRDYQRGDSLRGSTEDERPRWSAPGQSATSRPSPWETAIFLNLNGGDYPISHQVTATELGIVIAASLARTW